MASHLPTHPPTLIISIGFILFLFYRHQPDIASVSTVNIMDQSIESYTSAAASPPIAPEPHSVALSDEAEINSTNEIIESTAELIEPTKELNNNTTPLYENMVSETIAPSK